jgi:hypothetical protein
VWPLQFPRTPLQCDVSRLDAQGFTLVIRAATGQPQQQPQPNMQAPMPPGYGYGYGYPTGPYPTQPGFAVGPAAVS